MKRTDLFRDMSVKRKLMFIAFMSAGSALLFVMAVLAVQMWIVGRAELLDTEILQDMAIMLAAMLGGLGIAWMLVARLHPIITEPISELIGLMTQVSSDKNYALRAIPGGKDELGLLAEKFNEMLAKIQKRDDALARQRVQLVQAVAQRTASLTAAQRIAHIGNWDWDIVKNYLYFSDEIYRIFGRNRQQFEANYEAFLRVVHPEDRQFVDDSVRGAIEKRHPYNIDYRILLPDGAFRFVHVQGEVIFDQNGTSIKMQGTLQDITERKLVENQIRKQQELTTRIIETIPMRVFWKDRELHYLGCNTGFARDAGENFPGDLIGKDDFQLGWRELAEIYRADDRRVMATNAPKLSYDELQTAPTGERIWLRTSKVPLHNEADEVVGVLGTYEDITERKNLEIALRESEERFRTIFESVYDIIFTAESDGTLSSISPSFERMTGWLPGEWIGKSFLPLVYPYDQPRIQKLFMKLLSGETLPAFQVRHVTKSGKYLDTEITTVPIQRGGSTTIFGIVRDISERKQAEEKIRRLNEGLEIRVKERTRQLLDAYEELVRKEKLAVLGQVAGSVGHELRNPLGVMSNAVYFLQTVLSDADETTREYLGIIKSEIAASERIVCDLLDSVRTKPPHPETVGVAQLIEQSLGKCTIPPSVEVKLDIPTALPPLRVDAMQIHQVLRNLISNGVEAMQEGGTLEIRALEMEAEKNITISVRDAGIGMTPEQQTKLFQPLFTTKARGIGLGLVVVKNLTEANGGSIEVQSEAGKGTVFSVSFHYEMENLT